MTPFELVPDSLATGALVESVPVYCGALVGRYLLIAFKHPFVDEDEVLKGMLPGRY
jgi:cytochrome b561